MDTQKFDASFFYVPERSTLVSSIKSAFGVTHNDYRGVDVSEATIKCHDFKRLHVDGYTDIPFLTSKDLPLFTGASYISYLLKRFPKNERQKNFALDGISCCGKSTLLSKYRSYKVNSLLPQEIKTYNFDAVTSLSYTLCSTLLTKSLTDVAFDRSALANVAYQYVYYLMNFIKKAGGVISRVSCTSNFMRVSLPSGETPFALCENYTRMHHLEAFLESVNGARPNIVIVIDSDIESVMNRMTERGVEHQSRADLAKSSCPLYILAQNAAYAYLAHKCNLPCVDLHFLRSFYDENCWSVLDSYISTFYNVYANKAIVKSSETDNICIEPCDNLVPFSSHLADYTKLQLLKRVYSNR